MYSRRLVHRFTNIVRLRETTVPRDEHLPVAPQTRRKPPAHTTHRPSSPPTRRRGTPRHLRKMTQDTDTDLPLTRCAAGVVPRQPPAPAATQTTDRSVLLSKDHEPPADRNRRLPAAANTFPTFYTPQQVKRGVFAGQVGADLLCRVAVKNHVDLGVGVRRPVAAAR